MSSTLKPGEIWLPFRSVFVSNVVHYYVVLGFADVTFFALFGMISSSVLIPAVLILSGVAVAILPFILLAAALVTWLPIGNVWLRRGVASAIYASFANVGLTWVSQVVDRLTNQRGLWDLPIFVATLAGLVAGLAVKERIQRPRVYRAPSPPVV